MRKSGTYRSVLLTPDSAAYRNFIARTTNAVTPNQKAIYRYLLNSLTAKGFFDSKGDSTKLEFLYYFSTVDTTNAKLNLVKNSLNATENGTVTFNAGRGYTGNATNFYIDTGLNPSTSSIYAQDSAVEGVYVLNNRTTDAAEGQIGTTSGVGENRTITKNAGLLLYGINSVTVDNVANSTSRGSYVISRTNSARTDAYKNEVAVTFATTGSVARDNGNIYVFANNSIGGGPLAFTADEMSAAWAGSGWTSSEALGFQNILNQCMAMQGINVY